MKEYSEAIERIYNIAFSKFDKELITALETADSTLAKHKSMLTPEQLCKLYLTIGICKIKMDYSDDFLPMLIGAEQQALKVKSKPLLIRSLNLQANHLMRTGFLQDSVQKLLYLLEIVETEESKISNLNNLGLVYTSLGLYDKSLEALFESLRICEKIDSNRGYIRSCVNIGICYFELNNFEKAVEYFNAARKISDNFPFDESKMYLTVNLGLAYAHLNEFELALDYLNKALEMEKTYQFVKEKGGLAYNIGYVFERKGDNDIALSHYKKALEIVRTTPNLLLLISVLNNKAGVHIKLGEFKVAEELLMESLKITTDSNLLPQKQECLQKLSMLFESTGQYKKALHYINEFQRLNIVILNDKVKNGVIKYESDYLSEKLEQKAEIFRLQNVDLVEKNTIISQKQQQLEAALSELSESNATKDKLFSIVAHDLRGPVSSLQMALQLILAKDCTQEEQMSMLIQLNEQTKNTYMLLENLLWWSQIQREGFILHMEKAEINPIIDHILAIYKAIAHNKHVKLEVTLDKNMMLDVDKDALSLILRNLVGNAIKYSPPNTSVKISGHKTDKKVRIEIIDQGSGINPGIIASIRQNNRIQSIPGTDSEKGTGLGLSLCYEFAHKMNGSIILDKDYTEGTCFRLEFPI